MNWKELLNTEKLGEKGKNFKRYHINIFEQDYSKIVSSSAFRRLQDKTQVYPLDDSDFARTRLTHSIEVSTIAYQIGQMLVGSVPEMEEYHDDIPSLLRCAGVLHDLGNPPFGHFGEDTIGMWFRENLDKIKYKGDTLETWLKKLNEKPWRKELPDAYKVAAGHEKLGDEVIANLEKFEGNAQALRLLCKAKYAGDIDVTYAVISSLVKYPTDSLHAEGKNYPDIKLHKQGVYASEADVFDEISGVVGTRRAPWQGEQGEKNPGACEYCRHPLTFIMEASDDIAYATSDLEDSYKKGMFTLHQLRDHFEEQLAKEAKARRKNIKNEKYFRSDRSHESFDTAFQTAFLEKGVEMTAAEAAHKELNDMLNEDGQHELKSLWDSADMLRELRKYDDDDDRGFSTWLNRMRARLMNCVVFTFKKHIDEIMAGTFEDDMFKGSYQEVALKVMKTAMPKFVYDRSKISPTEISGHNSLSFLLDGFVRAALYADKDYCREKDEKGEPKCKPSDKDKKYWRLISEHFREDYEKAKTGCEPFDLYLRLLTVTDHISAMTDTYAHDLAATLRGF